MHPDPLPLDAAAITAPNRARGAVLAGTALLAALAAVAALAPWIAPFDPQYLDPFLRLQPPSAAHWFGTDMLGRDVFSRAIWAARGSLAVAAGVTSAAMLLGTSAGMACARSRRADAVLGRVADGLSAIPGLLLAMAFTAVSRPGMLTVVVAITVPEIPRVARLSRSLALGLQQRPFVTAARALGCSERALQVRHLLPNMAALLAVQASSVAATALLTEAALSFLGVGMPPAIPTWGSMMSEGRNAVAVAFHIVAFPGLLLGLTVLGANLLGSGLQGAPRFRDAPRR